MNINTNLESVLNLAPIDDDDEKDIVPIEVPPELSTREVFDQVDKIAAALPYVSGLDASERELDDLADLAVKAHKDIMDLGFNVDMKNAGEILSVAANMLGQAITAKTSKIQKKLKMIDLQIRNRRLDLLEAEKNPKAPEGSPIGQATEIDRNDLLDQIRNRTPKS